MLIIIASVFINTFGVLILSAINLQHNQMNKCNEPRCEKTRKREADQHLCFRYIDSTIPLLSTYEISSL